MLIKHEYPILERDTEENAVIMPCMDELNFPDKCVFGFLGDTIANYALDNNLEKVCEFESITKIYFIYKKVYKGEEILLCQAPCGSAPATQIMDFLICNGVKYIVSSGSCGALVSMEENEILIPTVALRDEGTSYHYISPSREIEINKKAVTSIKHALESMNMKYHTCKTWTTDGFYRETKEMVLYRKSEGCTVVEMECSALAACAQFRGAMFGQILYTADTLENIENHDQRTWGAGSLSVALELSLESVYQMGKHDMYDYLLFDLDGTITNPEEGITKSVQYALEHFGIEEELDNLKRFIGPPLRVAFSEYYALDKEQSEEAVAKYRETYSVKGLFENYPYDGIKELLQTLKDMGKTLIIATSKPTIFAKKVLEHFKLLHFFDFVSGSEFDGTRDNKADVIEYALEYIHKQNDTGDIDKSRVVMIGDREHDIIGATQNGLDSIGVLYGFGDRVEHEKAKSTYIAKKLQDILMYI